VYVLVQKLSVDYPVRIICHSLSISYSAYYAWVRQESYVPSSVKLDNAVRVKSVFETHKRRYGAVRISKALAQEGIKIGRHQVQNLMKSQDLKAIQPKSFVPKTTQTDPNLMRSPNLLLDRPAAVRPNEVFVGDITYIPLADGSWLYLAAWQDGYSRVIVGWELDNNMATPLIIKAIEKAMNRRKLPKGLIIHSDGGTQYASKSFRNLLKKQGFEQSMTRKDNHYDNAMAESCWSRLKAELLDKGSFLSFEDAYTEIFEYIEIYYNKQRLHSGIQYNTPVQYEELFYKRQQPSLE
jgi:transposase InsO family protein